MIDGSFTKWNNAKSWLYQWCSKTIRSRSYDPWRDCGKTRHQQKDAAALNAKDAFDVLVIDLRVQQQPSMQHVKVLTLSWTLRWSGHGYHGHWKLLQKTQGPKFAAEMEAHVRMSISWTCNVLAKSRVPTKWSGWSWTWKRCKTWIEDISTGARWREMNVPGEQEYVVSHTAHTVMVHCSKANVDWWW